MFLLSSQETFSVEKFLDCLLQDEISICKNALYWHYDVDIKMNIFCAPYNNWTSKELFAYYQTRQEIKYFPVVDKAETLRVKMDNILVNRFEFNNESYQLSEVFDWRINPSTDRQWLFSLHKFYYAVGLGIAYNETRDQRYVEKWINLISTWIDTVSIEFLPSYVTGRRVQNWIFAHYYFVTLNQTPYLHHDFYMKFLGSLYSQVVYLCEHLSPERNHRTLELYGIFLAAVVFPELKDADRRLEFAKQELLKNIQSDLLEDGVHCELSTDYHNLVLKNYLGIRRLALLNHISIPEKMDLAIRKALGFSLYVHKPDGLIPSLSDGDVRSFLHLLEQGYRIYRCEAMLHVASKGKCGRPPSNRSVGFQEGGYYILRSGWGDGSDPYEDERYLIFDCGPLGAGNHGHLDLLSFEMAAYGRSLIVDPGRYTYDESGEMNWRAAFRSTAYHNTVLVDNKNQTRYEFEVNKFKIKGREPDREVKAYINRPGFDYLHGVARSHEYDASHERKIFFLCPEYWIISDILHAEESHDYDLLFHLSDQAYQKVSVANENATLLVNSPHLVMVQARDPKIELYVEDGYISRTYGVKHRAPVLRFHRHDVNAVYHTILYPYKLERPEIHVEELSVLCGTRICAAQQASALCIIIIKNGKRVKDYYFTANKDCNNVYSFGDFTYNGAFLFVRKNSEGKIVSVYGEPDTVFTESGRVIPLMESNQ